MANEKVLVTVAARGGSKGLKNKNIKDLCGLPLIAHTIRQAKRWGKASAIICTTDSDEIAEIARSYGAEIPFMRPQELATDTAGKVGVIRHALGAYEKVANDRFDIVVDLDVTAPIRRNSDLDGALNLFKKERPKTVFSVTRSRKNPYFNMVEIGDDGYAHLVKRPPSTIHGRQGAPDVFDMNASIYVYDREYLMDPKTTTAISDRSLIWEMDELSAVDIDREIDFHFIEFLVKKGIVKL